MKYAMHESEAAGGRLFECAEFTQRVGLVASERGNGECDEVLYVLSGSGRATIDGHAHELRPGTAVFVARGTPWSATGDARAVSVLVHDPAPATAAHAVVDLTSAAKGTATAGREFVLGAAPEVGCASVTQFIGLIPPGRAPDHFHRYDEVIYVLEGEGTLEIGGEQAPLTPGTCVHLPRTLVHCLANTGDDELRVLGVFTPAGSPAEAYYPDGTLAVLPGRS
ncbi:MAG TPA: cupin domain-containing protein [Gaiellaceae bacterium]|nr:cupin domain-containing protein [Gaiellaceae bacterium]